MSESRSTVPSEATASPHEAAHFHRHAMLYLAVGAILLAGTALTVAASFVDFGTISANVKVALVIAAVKASLVALVFMHLREEKVSIYQIVTVTGVFAAGLILLSLLAFYDHIHL
jgi:cytochrome c oxidase subunit 4